MHNRPSCLTIPVSRRRMLQAAVLATLAGDLTLAGSVAGQEEMQRLKPAAFKRLSEAMSDMHDLSDDLLETYFSAMHSVSEPLETLYWNAGLEESEDSATQVDLTRLLAGNPSLQEAVAELLLPWYTGVVNPGTANARVVTFTGALAWQALAYTNAPTFCGGATGYWSSAPEKAGANG